MKRIALVLAVFVSLMLPSTPCFAEWFKVTESVTGVTTYIDTKIRKHDGHIYYWFLEDHLKTQNCSICEGSAKTYYEADCGKFKYRWLKYLTYEQPMGEGRPSYRSHNDKLEWQYPVPDTPKAVLLEAACDRAK